MKRTSASNVRLYMNKRATRGESYEPTRIEQITNVLTHGVAIIPSIYAWKYLLSLCHGSLQFKIAFVYGFFTVLLFSTSTSYHLSELLFRSKRRTLCRLLHIVDRGVIYFFIAASYMPWLTLRYCGYSGFIMKWMIWIFAILGSIYQYALHEKYKALETILYFVVAVLPSFVTFHMNNRSGLVFLLAGGIIIIIGVVFFKLDGRVPFAHAIWHITVVIGISLHFYAVSRYLFGNDYLIPLA